MVSVVSFVLVIDAPLQLTPLYLVHSTIFTLGYSILFYAIPLHFISLPLPCEFASFYSVRNAVNVLYIASCISSHVWHARNALVLYPPAPPQVQCCLCSSGVHGAW